MTRPLRRITLHFSQIGFTLGLTFTALFLCGCCFSGAVTTFGAPDFRRPKTYL